MRIADGVFWMAERDGDKVAIRDHVTGTRPGHVTFRELADQMTAVGWFFRHLGGSPGDVVAIYLDNSPEFLALFLGLAHAGFVVAPLNTRLTRAETDAIVNNMQPWRIVTEHGGQFVVRQRFDAIANDVKLDLGASAGAANGKGESVGLESVEPDSLELDADLSDSDTFYLGYSSGTTGQPKGLLRTHKSWTESFFGMTLEFGLATDTVLLVPGPLCYSASLIAALHALFIGGTVSIERSFDPGLTAKLLSDPASSINAVFMVPAMYRAVLDTLANDGQSYEPRSKGLTCVTCGDKMPRDLYERFTHHFPGARVFEYYGSSEVGFVSAHDFAGTHGETVGQPFFPARVRTVEGEIQVKSGLGFAGYTEAAEDQIDRIRRPNGWLAPGDHGRIINGWLHVTGRSSDLIVRGGVNLYPAEIESVVRSFPGVTDTAVFGVPHDRLGEVPICAVVWQDGVESGSAAEDLSENLRHALAGYKQPDDMWSLPSLPRNVAGKVNRNQLRKLYLERHADNSGAH